MNPLSGLLGSIGVVLAALAGCGGSDLMLPGSGTPADLQLLNGNNQIGPAGSPLAQPIEVKVLDDRGGPLSGHTVDFALDTDAPGARLDPASVLSDRQGVAQSRWTLGATSGIQSVVARVARGGTANPLEVRFNASVEAGAADRLAQAGGNGQSGVVGARLGDPLVVTVTDHFGNPIAGVTVNWQADEGDVDPGSSVTGSDGRAQTSWTLGSASGSQSASASSSGLTGSPIGFTATARAGSPDRLLQVSGDDQSAQVGTTLDNRLVVRLVDRAGNGVPDRAVSWVIATGGGSVDQATSTTDGEGEADVRWTLGPGPGGNTLNAVVSGVGFVRFSATATQSGGGGGGGGGGSAARLAFRVQPSDTERDRRIEPAVEVVVLDQAGNRVTQGQFKIKLELTGDDNGKLKGRHEENTDAGIASFNDLRIDREGEYRLRASADRLPSVESDRFEVQED